MSPCPLYYQPGSSKKSASCGAKRRLGVRRLAAALCCRGRSRCAPRRRQAAALQGASRRASRRSRDSDSVFGCGEARDQSTVTPTNARHISSVVASPHDTGLGGLFGLRGLALELS